jgi:hypothetical protein
MLLILLALMGFFTTALAAALPQTQVSSIQCSPLFNDFIIVEGATFEPACDSAYDGPNVGGATKQPTFQACLARCAIAPTCAAVNWNSADQKCDLKSSAARTVTSPFTWAAKRVAAKDVTSTENEVSDLTSRQFDLPDLIEPRGIS